MCGGGGGGGGGGGVLHVFVDVFCRYKYCLCS